MQIFRKFLKSLATFFGVGFAPKAPGTFGTLAALPIAALIMKWGPLVHMIVCGLLLPLAIMAAQVYETDKGGHDHKEIVIDEVLGLLITLTWLPFTWQSFIFGFILFRILDILKPFPIGYLDKKIPGGAGVVMDDVAAGIIANILLQAVYHHTGWLGVTLITISEG